MLHTIVSIPGYHLAEELYNGSRTLVYRGYREADSLPVVIKLLKNPYPTFSELLQFRNQYTIAKNLNSPLIIQTYSLEPYQNGYALVLEDFGGISLKDYFAGVEARYIASSQEFFQIAIALCNALNLLYHERIIHKDIKPANILINPETKQVKLIDFSIASLLPRETQTLINPNVLEGTLAYISPEQTGRMNRGIDYRTDFYSLGVTFYELLTGELPFQSNDPMELVHSHIAKLPPLIHEINPQIPSVLSEIVSKLIAKNAEERYQSALGLKVDLEKCLCQLEETGEIRSFEIGRRDVCDRFIIPDQLYGRKTEVETLLQAFERVSLGATEMMLVAGFSGIGKTAVVNEVHKPIVKQRGYFIKGKYDQFQRNIPFSAFVQAFRDLMEQFLAENDVQLEQWKNQILEAVGENGQVIIEVIPELSRIIGEQPPAVELSGTAAQNRFNLLFQKFTQVFTSAEHPLVMFLDDLQWADSASLKLMQLLMTDTSHLLLIGAYRDNEVNPAHPLMLTLSEIQKTQVTINTITLAPLSQVTVNQLVADTLKCTEDLAWNLSVSIYQKTQGNPFFATQFLKALHQEKLIQFDVELGCWQCDIAQLKTQTVTDNVVEFMAFQLGKLPYSTQEVLQLAACIGNSFDLETLAIVSSQSEIETAAALWKALQEGFILPISDVYKFYVGQETQIVTQGNQETVAYKFLHDRVQQGAYSLIPEDEKQATHLKIGQLLLQNISAQEREQKLFNIVNQLNMGIPLLQDPKEREDLAQMNLAAAQKAKASVAYDAACNYLQTALGLMSADGWHTHYPLMLQLHTLLAETYYLNTQFGAAQQQIEIVIQQAQTILERVKAYEIRIQLLIAQNQCQAAVDVGFEVLVLLDISIDTAPLPNIDIERLYTLPALSDPRIEAALNLLSKLQAPATVANPELAPKLIATMLNLCVAHGNSAVGAFAYSLYGLLLCATASDLELGYRFGQLAMQVLEQYENAEFTCKTNHIFHSNIRHWKERVHDCVECLAYNVQTALETGDVEFACYSACNYCDVVSIIGEPLANIHQKQNYYIQLTQSLKQEVSYFVSSLWGQFVDNLMGDGADPKQLVGKRFDEQQQLASIEADHNFTPLFFFHAVKTILYYLFNDYESALQSADLAAQYEQAGAGLFSTTQVPFYRALALLSLHPTADSAVLAQRLADVEQQQQRLTLWATHAPENFQHKADLVAAETARVLHQGATAVELYDCAITGANVNGYTHEAALSNELAAKFYLDWGKEKIAQDYLTQSYYGYSRWGAKAKVADLEKRYPQLLALILQQTRSTLSINETIFALGSVTSTDSATSSTSASVALDLAAILKASQTLSGEIELEKLLSSLLSIVIENAGADKCVLMLLQDNRLLIKGLITQGSEPVVLQSLAVEDSQEIPHKLIYKVLRNQQTVVLIDATADRTLANDPYIIRQQPSSILCSPILHQGKLLGILYLENNLATGAFTSDRVELLNLLCAQAAISLENARLYERSQQNAQQLEQSFNQLSAAQSRFHNLVDNVPGVVYQYHLSADGVATLTYISADCYNLYEITPEQAAANVDFLTQMVHPEDMASYQQSTSHLVQTLSSWHWEGRIITPSGIVKWIHGESQIQRFADGSMVWDGLYLDISDRKLAELALQQAQLQIVQSEKMSALGNLVAGVAHEINNPVGCIVGNVGAVQDSINDLFGLIDLYKKQFPQPGTEIEEELETIDLEYLRDDLPKLIRAMKDGGDRIKSISKSLRTFSRADSDQKQTFNLHEGIDSTILILRHRLKANETRPAIEVVTKYADIPAINCFPGQLNQVFMNILANAIDALDELNNGRNFAEIKANPNCITIQTSVENEKVQIAILDNGKGMSESVKQKIFDHLFTTKAVGKGTGLGLAIARQIVESTHSGKLSCNSVLGLGTEFIIEIPV
ncbi:trifunctional serine/threonine-protein kinase/ATP-binding protein/sensor histidine kinase [Nostoc sp.]|uniref:trifunctional serine/threonine-protein kinase/ATP-binding protein/sensor histidine kinase n=1 Tax=Nostoc sp. TaxID=1180 RepID=UPI002FFB138E